MHTFSLPRMHTQVCITLPRQFLPCKVTYLDDTEPGQVLQHCNMSKLCVVFCCHENLVLPTGLSNHSRAAMDSHRFMHAHWVKTTGSLANFSWSISITAMTLQITCNFGCQVGRQHCSCSPSRQLLGCQSVASAEAVVTVSGSRQQTNVWSCLQRQKQTLSVSQTST